jgi:hypothetical protein
VDHNASPDQFDSTVRVSSLLRLQGNLSYSHWLRTSPKVNYTMKFEDSGFLTHDAPGTMAADPA